jgi:hypothetical protein
MEDHDNLQQESSSNNNVRRLDGQAPHPERLRSISTWHADQASAGDAVALMSICITTNGQVRSAAIGIEPVHADIILRELTERMAPRLRHHSNSLRSRRVTRVSTAIPIRRIA